MTLFRKLTVSALIFTMLLTAMPAAADPGHDGSPSRGIETATGGEPTPDPPEDPIEPNFLPTFSLFMLRLIDILSRINSPA